MAEIITSFRGEHDFLSNFYIMPDGSTLEHYYQAEKTLDPEQRQKILSARSPGYAKRLGRKANIRPDWEDIKLDTMWVLLNLKFSHPDLRQKLLDTGDAYLIEGNVWGDRYWGAELVDSYWTGENKLGVLLMRLREFLRGQHG